MDRIWRCIHCNVCKELDGSFRVLNCFLWPRGSRQAPEHSEAGAVVWRPCGAGLSVAYSGSFVHLSWTAAGAAAIGHEVHPPEQTLGNSVAADGGVAAVGDPRYRDTSTVGWLRYTHYVRSFAAGGVYGPPSGAVTIAISLRTEVAEALS